MPKTASTAMESERLVVILEDLFILIALQSGMSVESIRKHLRIDKWRVSNISKNLTQNRRNKSTKWETAAAE